MNQAIDTKSEDTAVNADDLNQSRSRFGMLELILVLAMHFLLYQLTPKAWGNIPLIFSTVWQWLDYTQWNRTTWFVVNVVFVFVLLLVRFGKYWKQTLLSYVKKRIAFLKEKISAEDKEQEAKRKLAEDWRERAKRRLPFK